MSKVVSHLLCRLSTDGSKFYTTRKKPVLLLLLLIAISTPLISFSSAQNPEKAAGRGNARPLLTSWKSSQLPNPKQCPTCPEPGIGGDESDYRVIDFDFTELQSRTGRMVITLQRRCCPAGDQTPAVAIQVGGTYANGQTGSYDSRATFRVSCQ